LHVADVLWLAAFGWWGLSPMQQQALMENQHLDMQTSLFNYFIFHVYTYICSAAIYGVYTCTNLNSRACQLASIYVYIACSGLPRLGQHKFPCLDLIIP